MDGVLCGASDSGGGDGDAEEEAGPVAPGGVSVSRLSASCHSMSICKRFSNHASFSSSLGPPRCPPPHLTGPCPAVLLRTRLAIHNGKATPVAAASALRAARP